MKRLSLILILLLSSFPGFSLSPLAAQGDEVNLLIQRIEARYGRMRGLAAEFDQVYSGPDGRARRESGRLFLARPRRMRWEYPGKLFIVNGRDVWFYVTADREATHADAGGVSDSRFPFLFLLGQTNLKRAFRSISVAEDGSLAPDSRTLRLVPVNDAGGFREIFLTATTGGSILKVKMVDASGATTEIYLRNVRENYVAPVNAFQFTPPPGVTVRRQK